MTRPRVLFMTSHWPLAPAHGAQQRVLNIASLLSRSGDVSFLIVDRGGTDQETVRRTKSEFDVRRVVNPQPVSHRGLIDRFRHRLRHDLDPHYPLTAGRAAAAADHDALLLLLKEHDVVWIHNILTAGVFHIDRWPHSVLDVDDLQSHFYGSRARTRTSPARRLLDLRMSLIWRRRERLYSRRFDVVTVCSERDRRELGAQPRIHVIPNGFSSKVDRPRVPASPARIGFIGTFEYRPNEEGVKWFIREVWPLVRRHCPSAQLRLVGRDSDRLTQPSVDVAGLGWLEDPADEIASWSLMIVPITFGGGTRVKIAEGFARRCPVVATTLGAFGYDVQNGKELLLADGAEAFASACVDVLSNPRLGEALAETAHARFLEKWTWDSFESRVAAAVQECLSAGHSG
jgi:glycosyltransferase involved in cell wall biosynthesis